MDIRQLILSKLDLPREAVQCPEWGCTLTVRAATGAERDRWESSNVRVSKDGKRRDLNLENTRARLVVMVTVDESGQRIFRDADAEKLGEKSAAVIDRLYTVAARLSGIGGEEKNSPEMNAAGSSSDSPQS